MPLSALRRQHTVHSEGTGQDRWEWIDSGGDGPVLVMLPGAQGSAESFFRQFPLARTARLIAVTYPADPDSDRVAGELAAFLDRRAAPKVVLLGTSLGGYIAQLFAARHADRLAGLVLTCTFADPGPLQGPDKLSNLEQTAPETLKAQVTARIEALPDSPFKDIQREIVGRGQSGADLRARMLAVQRARPVPPVAVAPGRMLIIDCDNDPLIPPPVREGVRSRYPLAAAVGIAGGGHYPYLLCPEEFNRAIATLLFKKGTP